MQYKGKDWRGKAVEHAEYFIQHSDWLVRNENQHVVQQYTTAFSWWFPVPRYEEQAISVRKDFYMTEGIHIKMEDENSAYHKFEIRLHKYPRLLQHLQQKHHKR